MSSFDQVIRNILAGIFAEEQQEETVRPRARPSGLGAPTTSVRPRARPEDLEPAKPTATETTTNFINEMANYDDSSDEGVEIPLDDLKTDARSLEGKFKTTATDLARLNRNSRGSKVRVKSVVPDDELDSIMSEVKTVLSASPATRKPRQFADLETQQLLYDVEKSVLSPRTQTRNPVLDASTAPEFTPRDFELTTKDIQSMLSTRGYDVGKLDGVMGPRTEAAIKQFQKDRGLKVDGKVGPKTRAAMEASAYSVPMDVKFSSDVSDMSDALTVSGNIKKSKEEKLDVQKALLELGYDVGAIDGIIGTKTRAAIRQFQKDQGLKADAIVGENTAAAMNAALSGRQAVDVGDSAEPTVYKAGMLEFPFLDKIVNNKYVDLATSTPAKLLMKNIMGLDRNQIMGNKPITIDETSFKEDELQHFRNMWLTYGAGKITKAQQVDSAQDAMNVITGKDKSALGLPANIRAYYSVGDTTLYQNEDGDVILKDQYDYNLYTDYTADPIINSDTGEKEYPRLKTEEFEAFFSTPKAIKDTLTAFGEGKIGFLSAAHNLGFLLGSRDYQDSDKDEGIPMLINLGNPETWGADNVDTKTAGLMPKPDITAEEDTTQIGSLLVSNATRDKYAASPDMFNISLDYNSFQGKSDYGTEVIIPDNADAATRAAALKYNKLMVQFAKKHGINNYKNRGVFTTSENKKRGGGGKQNTIHAEPFFAQDIKMVEAVNNNFEEFSKIYLKAFGELPARIVAPHTETNEGAKSNTFGSELAFGKRVIANLMSS